MRNKIGREERVSPNRKGQPSGAAGEKGRNCEWLREKEPARGTNRACLPEKKSEYLIEETFLQGRWVNTTLAEGRRKGS